MLKKALFALCLAVFWSVPSHAATVGELYEAEVPVPDQSQDSYKKGLSQALLQTLIKLSGDRGVQGRQGISELLNQPEQYLQQYKYRNKAIFQDNQLSLEQQLHLWASFNANTLDQALRNLGVPVWGRLRPATLVWLVIDENGQRRFVALEDDMGYTATLTSQAQSRAIPLKHPLLDAEDASLLKAADVWGGFPDPVKLASARYNADAILTGSLSPNANGGWEGKWALYIQDEPFNWTTTGTRPGEVLRGGIDNLADRLADRYVQTAVAGQTAGTVEIIVQDINDFEQYARVLKYLRTLNSVERVEVRRAEAGSVTYELAGSGDDIVIQRAIQLGRTLESLSGGGSPYRLVH